MKITSPSDKKADLAKLDQAIEAFEKEFKSRENGNSYYHLVIDGEYNRIVCDAVKQKYIEAGWTNVECRTSSENGERPGLTGLILEYKP